jgi:hypothetical protein
VERGLVVADACARALELAGFFPQVKTDPIGHELDSIGSDPIRCRRIASWQERRVPGHQSTHRIFSLRAKS